MSSEPRQRPPTELAEKIRPVLRAHGVVRASVFGSLARGDAQQHSDVDFLVVFEDGRSLLDLSALRIELNDVLDRAVDVATPGALHPSLRDRILSEQVRIV